MKNQNDEIPPRGQWMATEGRELYHTWITHLMDRYSADRATDETTPGYEYSPLVDDYLHMFASRFVKRIMSSNKKLAQEGKDFLIQAADQVKYYTSADDMLGELANWHRAIHEHARDGLYFASRVTLGLAFDAYQSTGREPAFTLDCFHELADILRNETFQKALEKFSTTGFGVFGNVTARSMLQEDMPLVVSNRLGLGSYSVNRVMIAERHRDGSMTYELHPLVSGKLHEFLREQNQKHIIRRLGSQTLRERLNDRTFTTGCPVRRAPSSEVEKGNNKSGIALLSEYLADELLDSVKGYFGNSSWVNQCRYNRSNVS